MSCRLSAPSLLFTAIAATIVMLPLAVNGLPGDDRGGERLVLGADAVRMLDHDDAAAGDLSGEADPAGRRGEHDRPSRPLEVDAAVPGGVRGWRWLERAQHS